MRYLLFGFSLLFCVAACQTSQVIAASPSTPEAISGRPLLDTLSWTTDLESAKKLATTNNLPILMVFSGSDWCRPCQAFKKEVLENETFRATAKNQVVVLYLDFPAKKRNQLSKEQTAENAKLAERYNKNGSFPTVLLLPSNGNTAPCELKYEGDGADAWLKKIDQAIEKCTS